MSGSATASQPPSLLRMRRQLTADRWRMTVDRWRMTVDRWRMTVDSWQMTSDKWQIHRHNPRWRTDERGIKLWNFKYEFWIYESARWWQMTFERGIWHLGLIGLTRGIFELWILDLRICDRWCPVWAGNLKFESRSGARDIWIINFGSMNLFDDATDDVWAGNLTFEPRPDKFRIYWSGLADDVWRSLSVLRMTFGRDPARGIFEICIKTYRHSVLLSIGT